MNEQKPDYYAMAKAWGEQYKIDNPEPKPMKFNHLHLDSDHLFIDMCILRMYSSEGAEKRAAYHRLREFKNFITKK